MALSMDEQRMLAEIERRLAADDPLLAARLTSFRLPRLVLAQRSQRSRLLAYLLLLALVAVVSFVVYALMPFRAQQARDYSVRHGSPAGHQAVLAPGKQQAPAMGAGPRTARAASSPRTSAPARSAATRSRRGNAARS